MGGVARVERQRAEVGRHLIAVDTGLSPTTIARFERAEAWPLDPEVIVDAIAKRAELAPQELWAAAVRVWNGETP